MLVLFETAAGYAIFKLLNEKKLQETDDLYRDFENLDRASKVVSLLDFRKFVDTTEALANSTALVEGKISPSLKAFLTDKLQKNMKETLLVADSKLGCSIKEDLKVSCISNSAVNELIRCIRSQTDVLLSGIEKRDVNAMALGLAHSLSRYKLKFSPDKVDTMVVQAVGLMEELDKELNNYVMRVREWYGWHFPEMGKIVTDNMQYVKCVRAVGMRKNALGMDLSEILPEDVEERVKSIAEMSMGTELAKADIKNIWHLCDQVIEITAYREQLFDYLKSRMMAIAPNLSVLLGELVGAKLIAQAGSLLNLAKHPASTVQILGAEKALFRALKTKRETPKYGIIYHTQLIGQAGNIHKGKMARMIAAKAALCIRVDALGDETNLNLGVEHRALMETKLRQLEEGSSSRIGGTAKAKAKFEKYRVKSEILHYPDAADCRIPAKKNKYSEKGFESASGKFGGQNTSDYKEKVVKFEPILEETTEGDACAQSSVITDKPSELSGEERSKKKKRKSKGGEAQPESVSQAEKVQEMNDGSEPTPKKKKKKSIPE